MAQKKSVTPRKSQVPVLMMPSMVVSPRDQNWPYCLDGWDGTFSLTLEVFIDIFIDIGGKQ